MSVHIRHFPLRFHKRAEPAARAVQAAERQGKGWDLSKVLYLNLRALEDTQIYGYAAQVGLNMPKFKTHYTAPDVINEVASDLKVASATGAVRGTPTIFINGAKFKGPRTVAGLQTPIIAEIARADALISSGTPLADVYPKLSK